MAKQNRTDLFEQMPVPRAVLSMSVPTIMSSLVSINKSDFEMRKEYA